MSNLILRFIAGPYLGAIYPLPEEGGEVSIGRGLDQSIILDDSLSSRHHAVVYGRGDSWQVKDMASTNGTFINGERQTEVMGLKVGDTILIGSSILRLDTANADESLPDVADVRAQMEQKATDNRQGTSTMSGSIDQVPVVDVLQLLFNLRKNGLLRISTVGHIGTITMDSGMVRDAMVDGKTDVAPEKSFYRIMRWTSGSFEFCPGDVQIPEGRQINASSEGLLLEAMRQIDELARLESKLPDASAFLEIPVPLVPQLSQLTPELLDILQLVHNHSQLQEVLDHSAVSDLDTAERLIKLIQDGYVSTL